MRTQGFGALAGKTTMGVLAVMALLASVTVQAELLDDFADGDDVGWTRFTLPDGLPGAQWDAGSGAYHLWVDGSAPLSAAVCSYLNITNDPYYSEGYWWAVVVRKTDISTTQVFMRGEFAPRNAYGFGWYPESGLTIQLVAGGGGVVLGNDDSFIQEVGVWYMLEAGANGGELELRMWPVGEARPELPQVSVTDYTYPQGANGIVAQASSAGALSASFDDVCFAQTGTTGVPGWSIGNMRHLVAFPNPSSTAFRLRVPQTADGVEPRELLIIDARGLVIDRLVAPGTANAYVWDGHTRTGQRAASGVYFAVMRVGSRTESIPLQLVR